MEFNVKKLASDAGVFFSRAMQFTEEKLGQAEKTELDAHFENLLARADCTKNWTEKILRQTEVLLQPNPSARVEEFLYEKLDRKVPSRVTNGELLAQYMTEAANDFGPGTPYGKTLIKVGETQRRLGAAEREFIRSASISFLTPLRNFLEGDWRTISKERRILQNRRLDLDACKARLKKAKAAEAKAACEGDVSIDCANSAVIFFFSFNTSHCLFPIFKKKIHLSLVPLGLALEHVLSVIRAVAAWGRCSRRVGVSEAACSPSGASLGSIHVAASSAQERQGLPRKPPGVGWPVPLWKGSPETMTGRMIWLCCCSAPFPHYQSGRGREVGPF
ncbi:endophilin-B2 isoform X4 [Melozone crissalis]|uniref:endophilin-B2 isoform X4 n=1 Tax=Melozone crissalis TaxID=40204 RepID=UPI0023DAE499|nr:endophilin-B2 isoform X4 [Melozone crissalis]